MNLPFNRRQFLASSGAALAAGAASQLVPISAAETELKASADDEALFKISLAQWSLHRTLRSGKIDNLDFPIITKEEFGIDGVEFVNQFFKDKAKDGKYLAELKKRCSDNGVLPLLIMIDGEGRLGDPDESKADRGG
jgi:L-ribulose-5-phosphate 3-epimerase